MRSLLLVLILALPAAGQQPSCVKVWDGDRGVGSGTVVRKEYVLTNAHMVEKRSPRIVTQDGKEYVGQVRKVSSTYDLAIIRVPELPLPPVTLAPAPLTTNERVRQWGFPLNKFKFTEGLRDRLRSDSSSDFLFTTSQTDHGDSGSGWFNDKGELVGVQFGVLNDPATGKPMIPKVSIGVPLEKVRKFLGPTVQVISASWCGPCQKMKPELSKVTEVDVEVFEDDQNKTKVAGFPTLILYDQDFKEVKRKTGAMTADQIKAWIKE